MPRADSDEIEVKVAAFESLGGLQLDENLCVTYVWPYALEGRLHAGDRLVRVDERAVTEHASLPEDFFCRTHPPMDSSSVGSGEGSSDTKHDDKDSKTEGGHSDEKLEPVNEVLRSLRGFRATKLVFRREERSCIESKKERKSSSAEVSTANFSIEFVVKTNTNLGLRLKEHDNRVYVFRTEPCYVASMYFLPGDQLIAINGAPVRTAEHAERLFGRYSRESKLITVEIERPEGLDEICTAAQIIDVVPW